MVHDQSLLRQAHLAAAVPAEYRLPMPAKKPPRMPAPVVTRSAETAGNERGTAAGPAPPGGLLHLPAPGWFSGRSLPCPAAPDRTRIHSSGKPFVTEASNRVRSSQAESRSLTAGQSQRPGKTAAAFAVPDPTGTAASVAQALLTDIVKQLATVQQNKQLLRQSSQMIALLQKFKEFFDAEKLLYGGEVPATDSSGRTFLITGSAGRKAVAYRSVATDLVKSEVGRETFSPTFVAGRKRRWISLCGRAALQAFQQVRFAWPKRIGFGHAGSIVR